jgi:hypothetical protein
MSADELGGFLSLIFTRVLAGATEPGVGTACATLAKAILAVNEAGAIETRLTALEAAAKTKRRIA